jgi:Sec-independent protein translocase protein TatA
VPLDIGLVLLVILVLVLLWRGPTTLPKLGQALGRGVREARDAASGDDATTRTDGDNPTTTGVDETGRPR